MRKLIYWFTLLFFYSYFTPIALANMSVSASQVAPLTSGFSKNLNNTDTDQQKVDNAVDQFNTITGSPHQCSAGQFPLGIDTAGNAQGCTAAQSPISTGNLTGGTGISITNGIGAVLGSGTSILIASGFYLPTTTDQTNWNGKQNAITPGTVSQYLRGDLSLATFPTNLNQFINGPGYIALTGLSGGTGISYNNTTGVITNSSPNQVVSLSNGTGISISGSYPNFTITNTSPSSGGTVTSVTASAPLSSSGGTTPNLTFTNPGYITGNQNISLSGDVTGSGATSISTSVVKVNGASVPTTKTIIGTNSSGQIIDASSASLSNNTSGTAANISGTQTANYIYAAPNGSNGAAGFRAQVLSDLPVLPWIKFTLVKPNYYVSNVSSNLLIWRNIPTQFTVAGIYCTGGELTTTQYNVDLDYATAFIGMSGQTLINNITTSSDVFSKGSGFTNPIVPAGSDIYLAFQATPDSSATQFGCTIWGHF